MNGYNGVPYKWRYVLPFKDFQRSILHNNVQRLLLAL